MDETDRNLAPLSITEADLKELEEVGETRMSPPRTETRRVLEELPSLLAYAQRRTTLLTGMLGGMIAVGVALVCVWLMGLRAEMTATSAIETTLIAATVIATLTYMAAVLVGFGRRAEDERVARWMTKLEESLR